LRGDLDMASITKYQISLFKVLLIFIPLVITACGGSSDDPPPADPATSSTWGEMKWGEGTWGK
jgi:Na+-translocating ferredoxin:NAD+ oxidoreductase RnfE subunit